MKILLSIILILFVSSLCYADELCIPYQCFPKMLQSKFAEQNLKLDINGDDRTFDSWGFIRNEGGKYTIITYNSVTINELETIKKIVMEIERWRKAQSRL